MRTDDTGVIVHAFKILEALASRHDRVTCFDVGAYIGVISLAMASRLRDSDVVHSFEPNSLNYHRLLDNLKLNRSVRVMPSRLAMSDVVAQVILKTPRNPSESFVGVERTSVDEHGKGTIREEPVQADRIDAFAARNQIGRIDLLKIDAEYHDDRVLSGCGRMLEGNAIPYVVFEYQEGEQCGQRCWQLLESKGYSQFFIVRNGDFLVRTLSDYPREKFKPVLNVLAISPGAPCFAGGIGLDVI